MFTEGGERRCPRARSEELAAVQAAICGVIQPDTTQSDVVICAAFSDGFVCKVRKLGMQIGMEV